MKSVHDDDATRAQADETTLCARFAAAVPAGLDADAHLVWRGRHLRARCLVQIGATAFLLRIEAGRVTECRTPPALMSAWDFAVRGSVPAWEALWRALPPPGWHDLFALSKRGEMTIEGDLHPFVAHLQYVKDLLALPRAGGGA